LYWAAPPRSSFKPCFFFPFLVRHELTYQGSFSVPFVEILARPLFPSLSLSKLRRFLSLIFLTFSSTPTTAGNGDRLPFWPLYFCVSCRSPLCVPACGFRRMIVHQDSLSLPGRPLDPTLTPNTFLSAPPIHGSSYKCCVVVLSVFPPHPGQLTFLVLSTPR